uniref:Uncharacterized protein n=1 Tax=Anguilla anguilla TaxID=7936 RepID=A0A0E9SCM6_ANGAN
MLQQYASLDANQGNTHMEVAFEHQRISLMKIQQVLDIRLINFAMHLFEQLKLQT